MTFSRTFPSHPLRHKKFLEGSQWASRWPQESWSCPPPSVWTWASFHAWKLKCGKLNFPTFSRVSVWKRWKAPSLLLFLWRHEPQRRNFLMLHIDPDPVRRFPLHRAKPPPVGWFFNLAVEWPRYLVWNKPKEKFVRCSASLSSLVFSFSLKITFKHWWWCFKGLRYF